MDYTLHPATLEDQTFLSGLFHDVHAPEFALLALPAAALDQLLAMQANAQRSGYAAQFPDAFDRIVQVAPSQTGKSQVGRVMVHTSAGEMRLVDIALLASHRGQGIGQQILKDLCEQAVDAGLPLRLTVRGGNPAQHLYERAGFVVTGGDGLNLSMEFRGKHRSEPVSSGSSAEEAATMPAERVPQDYTANYFGTLTGQTMKVRDTTGTEVELLLQSVQRMAAPPGGPVVQVGDSFTLIFRGPRVPQLASAIAEVLPEGADPMSFFLAPFKGDAEFLYYEAVFNRMTL